jgi:hypothetical protein
VIRRSAWLAVLALMAISARAPAGPKLPCFWVEGRLFAANGAPTWRIWPKGTRRLLGVVSPSGSAERSDLLPAEVLRLNPDFEHSLRGQFRVCPLGPDRAGAMRFVELVEARGLVVVAR